MSPVEAALEGIDTSAFDGPVVAATTWPAIDVARCRVGIIVTGPTGMALTPEVARRADQTTIFHRHPAHVLPSLPIVRGHRIWPLARRVATLHRRLVIRDREMRRQLTPHGGHTVVRSNRWYPALQRESCRLISWPIASITPTGVRTADGVEHLLDLLIVD